MQMQLYFIQYPFIYLSYGTSQRPVVTSNNLVERDFDCSKKGEKNIKQDSGTTVQNGMTDIQKLVRIV